MYLQTLLQNIQMVISSTSSWRSLCCFTSIAWLELCCRKAYLIYFCIFCSVFSSQGPGIFFRDYFVCLFVFPVYSIHVKTHFHTLALCEAVDYIPAALEEQTHQAVTVPPLHWLSAPWRQGHNLHLFACVSFFVVVVFFLSHTLTIQCVSDDFIKLPSAADCVVWIRLGCSCSRWPFHVHGYILHM